MLALILTVRTPLGILRASLQLEHSNQIMSYVCLQAFLTCHCFYIHHLYVINVAYAYSLGNQGSTSDLT